MKKLLSGAALMMAVALVSVTRGSAADANPENANKLLEEQRKAHDLPSLAVVVTRDGKICERAAVGLRKLGAPDLVTTNDMFHIGSCTKSMTATLAGMLIDDGKLRWDTTIIEVFPELKGKIDSRYETVTIEQLLMHRGGFSTEPPAMAWKRAATERGTPTEQRREFIEGVLNKPPKAPPGTKMIYSNQGYAVAGAMIEKVTGKSYETLITERLFQPLHMTSAGFGPPGSKDAIDQPWGHTKRQGAARPVFMDNPPAVSPAGRVHCSLDDLARYTMFHLQGDKKLLKPETLAKLHAAPQDGGDYACGWIVLKRSWAKGKALMHNGSNTMWYVVMWLAPERNFSVIAATNIGGPAAEEACDQAASAMISKWLEQ